MQLVVVNTDVFPASTDAASVEETALWWFESIKLSYTRATIGNIGCLLCF